jgi:hypothetical protein
VLANFSQNTVSFAERWFLDAYIVTAIATIVHGGSASHALIPQSESSLRIQTVCLSKSLIPTMG